MRCSLVPSSELVAKANVNAALKNLDDGSEEYNLMTDLYSQLDKCMQQNTVLRQQNAELIKKNKDLASLAAGAEGGGRRRRKTKSKRRRRRRRTRRRQRGRG